MIELNRPPDARVNELRARQLTRWESGERVLLESLLVEHPDLLNDSEALLDLIYAELLLREEFGERPDVEEYVRRFPSCESGIRRQFAFHDAIGALDSSHAGADSVTLTDSTLAHPATENGTRITEIGPYEILGEIGAGGMGVVYRGRHRTLSRMAAIKMPRAGAGDEERERFLTEARAMAALQHPNIVRIYDISDPQYANPFVALEYVEGGSLADRINGTPLSPREAAALLLPLAEAIDHAHQRGILHRDLKPSNILVDGNSEKNRDASSPPTNVKVTDFGLAKQIDADSSHTRTGVILGSPSYMAPEQARGRNQEVGPLTDVYGLGAILYEMLTGRPPFKADTVLNTLAHVVEEEAVSPRSLQPGIPRDLETICLKCLHKTPSRRYSSAAELAGDLRRFLAGEPIQARPAGMLERAGKWVRRRPAAALVIGGSLLALAAFVALWFMFTLRLDKEKRQAIEDRNEAQKQSERARHLLALSAASVDEIAINVRNSKAEENRSGNTGTVLFKLACFYSKTSKTLGSDPDLSIEDRAHLADQYARSAVRLLVCAEQIGFFERPGNRQALEKNADLAGLRSRGDYKQLVARLPRG